MTDSYELPASQLSREEIGKTVRVAFSVGRIESTLTDVLTGVTHSAHSLEGLKTTLHFEETKFNESGPMVLLQPDRGLLIPGTAIVVVNP